MAVSVGNQLPPAIFLMGPTASGKTDLAVAMAEQLPCDIISVDSSLVYRGMDIGSAKPDAATLAKAPHRLIDIRNPDEPYSVADFRADALREMADITAQGRIPLLVGGTMLYFKALLEGLADLPQADAQIRADIEAEAEVKGWPAMHRELATVDPKSADRIHPNHSQRIGRALEVYRISGQTMTSLRELQAEDPLPYRPVQFALIPESRSWLHERIALRFEKMMAEDFLVEVEGLFRTSGIHKDLPALRAVGYRQAWDYLGGNITREEMIERAIIATRQLSKRQLTWLRSWPDLYRLPIGDHTDIRALYSEVLKVLRELEISG